ncbi:MAG: hypothetical protein ACI9SB_000661 [Candidatus Azotimanducaceae bacterium]|jgi:hypothetical protein
MTSGSLAALSGLYRQTLSGLYRQTLSGLYRQTLSCLYRQGLSCWYTRLWLQEIESLILQGNQAFDPVFNAL